MKNKNDGFTLVELVIVIAVIAILAAVLVPTFSSVISKAQQSSDIQLMTQLNTELAIEEIDKSELKEHELITDGWEFAYSRSHNRLVIVKALIIVAAWDKSLVGTEIDDDDFILVSNLQDEDNGDENKDPSGVDNNGDDNKGTGGDNNGDNNGQGGENQDPAPWWEKLTPIPELPTDDEQKRELLGELDSETGELELRLDDNINDIAAAYFKGCKTIKRIYLGAAITEIPNDAFNDCTNLEEVYCAGKVTSIGDGAFRNCSSLNKINLDYVMKIGQYAFFNCTGLKNLTLPQTLNKVHHSAFNGCIFENLTIPCIKNITDIKIITSPDLMFTVAKLEINGGENKEAITSDFASWIQNIIIKCSSGYPTLEVTIKNITISENPSEPIHPFSVMTSEMHIYGDEESIKNVKDAYHSSPFGAAKVN